MVLLDGEGAVFYSLARSRLLRDGLVILALAARMPALLLSLPASEVMNRDSVAAKASLLGRLVFLLSRSRHHLKFPWKDFRSAGESRLRQDVL